MKVTAVSSPAQTTTHQKKHSNNTNTSFKSLGMSILSASGALMQGIENKGYLVSFLIQDGLGMTLPRVATGFHRDKEQTGEYNVKEGLEVLGREGMTGPFMISVAPLMLFLTQKLCRSAGTNTRLIKILGQNMKDMLNSPDFKPESKRSREALRREFYKYNITKFYKDSIPGDKHPEETIKYILDEFEGNFSSKYKEVRNDSYKDILNKLNEKMLDSSSDLSEICRLSAELNGKKQTFAAGDVIKAIKDYADDAITNNPNFDEIDAAAAENIKNNFAAKRLLMNAGGIGGTLGGLSILPKIYARSNVSPGAARLIKEKEAQKNNSENNENVSFKGKGINNKGFFASIGNFLTKRIPAIVQQEFEYNGYNFTPTMMACLSLFGLLLPRGLRAYNRAYVDENGKKDFSEINEILLRDSISSLAVVYTVPILTKCIVNSYENKRGFILTNRASMHKSKWQKFLDVINPYSDLKVLTNTELESLYGSVNNKTRMMNFTKFINEKGGDLEKIFSKSKNANHVFNNDSFTLESIKHLTKEEKNEKIISLFNKMKDNKETSKLITKLMKDDSFGQKSSIVRLARGLNSIPGAIVTVLISPIILGCFIPLLTYSNTRKSQAKMLNSDNQNK